MTFMVWYGIYVLRFELLQATADSVASSASRPTCTGTRFLVLQVYSASKEVVYGVASFLLYNLHAVIGIIL